MAPSAAAETSAQPSADALGHIYPFGKFATLFERQGLGTEFSLRWLVRYREQNGLLASGAVIEKRTPGHQRPRLFINAPKFAAWMAQSDPARGIGR